MGADASRLRAVVLAYHEIGCVCLEELLDQGDEVLAVFTHEDDPREEIWFPSVKELALDRGLPTFAPEDINRPEWIERIRSLGPAILFSFYYRKLVREEILSIPPLGCLNLHGSLLPRYRGRAPVNWVLVHGEHETGVTLHYMNARPDAGDIVAQKKVPIVLEDTARTLFGKMVPAARALVRETLPLLRAGAAPRVPQDLSRGSYFGGRRPEDGRIDWKRSSIEIHNLVRAVTHPYPGAFAYLGDRKLWIWKTHPLDAAPGGGRAGEVIASDAEGGAAVVRAGAGALRVERVQLDGEPERPGSRLVVGSALT